jgi:uncharacterized protein (DUF362 family)
MSSDHASNNDGHKGSSRRVAACFAASAEYPSRPPYHPEETYPEYPFREAAGRESNPAYAAVRKSLQLLGLDGGNFGSPTWNPLGEVVRPGSCVLLKPNFIKEHRVGRQEEWVQIITHGSVIRAVADYVYIALKGRGRLIVADGPQSDSNFHEIGRRVALSELQEFYRSQVGFHLEFYDLRNEHWMERDGIYVGRERLSGDPAGTVLVDLGARSHFGNRRTKAAYYGAFYDVDETNHFHSVGRHAYAFCRTPLLADTVIHLPKLKTHKKCGITVNLKGLVGLNGNKNLLPHYCFGSPNTGGDQFQDSTTKHRLENFLVRPMKRLLLRGGTPEMLMARRMKRYAYRFFGENSTVVRSGNWHGNDTVWRMALDLNAILTFADRDGILRDSPQRRFFSVVDGIIAGEGNGPLDADAKPCGLVIAGSSPVLVDAVCARLMGFDYRKIPLVIEALLGGRWAFAPCTFDEIEIVSNRRGVDSTMLTDTSRMPYQFEPHLGWKGHLELEARPEPCPTVMR